MSGGFFFGDRDVALECLAGFGIGYLTQKEQLSVAPMPQADFFGGQEGALGGLPLASAFVFFVDFGGCDTGKFSEVAHQFGGKIGAFNGLEAFQLHQKPRDIQRALRV